MALPLDPAPSSPTLSELTLALTTAPTTHHCTASRTCTFTTTTFETWVTHELSTHAKAHDVWYCHHTLSHHSTFVAPDPACHRAFRTRAAFEKHFYGQHARDDLGGWSRLEHADFQVGPRGAATEELDGQGHGGQGRLFWCGFCRRVLGCSMTGLWGVDRFEHVAGHFARAHARLEFMEMKRWEWLVVEEEEEEKKEAVVVEEKEKEKGEKEGEKERKVEGKAGKAEKAENKKKKEEEEKKEEGKEAAVAEKALREGKRAGLRKGENAPMAVMVSPVGAGAGTAVAAGVAAGAVEGAGQALASAGTRAPTTQGLGTTTTTTTTTTGFTDLNQEEPENIVAKRGGWLGTAITGEVVMPSTTESAPMFGMIIPPRGRRRGSSKGAVAEGE